MEQDSRRLRYVLLDTEYARPSEIGLDGKVAMRGRWQSFELYEVRPQSQDSAAQARASL